MAINGLALTTIERFLTKVDVTNTCWNWLGHENSGGYGSSGRVPGSRSTPEKAHRRAYRLLVGQINAGMYLHHTCGNKRCVNPEHLQQLSPTEHGKLHAAKTTACRYGHPYPESAYTRKNGTQVCRVCDAGRKRKSRKITVA